MWDSEKQVKKNLRNDWLCVSYTAERLSAKRVGELTFSLSKMEIINDLCKSNFR